MAHDHGHDYAEDRVPPELLQQIGYETRDVTPGSIIKWGVGLLVFIAVVTGGIVILENAFIPETGRVAYESEIYRTAPIHNEPPQPQLQVEPKRDIISYRKDEARVLNGYSPTTDGRVSIPVDQEIDKMAAEGISGVTAGAEQPESDKFPGYNSLHPEEAENGDEPKTVEAPTTQDPGDANVAAPQPNRATDSITEERKNAPEH